MHVKIVKSKGKTYYYWAQTEWDKEKKRPSEKTIRRLTDEELEAFLESGIKRFMDEEADEFTKEFVKPRENPTKIEVDSETRENLTKMNLVKKCEELYLDEPFQGKGYPKSEIKEILTKNAWSQENIDEITSSKTKCHSKFITIVLRELERLS